MQRAMQHSTDITDLHVLVLRISCNFTHCPGEKDWSSLSKDILKTSIEKFIQTLESCLRQDPGNLKVLKVNEIKKNRFIAHYFTLISFSIGISILLPRFGKHIRPFSNYGHSFFAKHFRSGLLLHSVWCSWPIAEILSTVTVQCPFY